VSPAERRIGFIGAGKMATALAQGLLKAGFVRVDQLLASDPVESARQRFQEQTGACTTVSNEEVVRFASLLVLAVQPPVVVPVLRELRPHLHGGHLLVSIAAGVSTQAILHVVGPEHRVVRVMPNTPALIGAAAAAYCLGGRATAEDGQTVAAMLRCVGRVVEVEERLMDAVTALSGSGPAYVYQFIEALSDGGVRMGLPRAVAMELAAQTVLGAARMVLETGLHPAQLKDQVASPGGTTIAGLHELERGAVRAAVMNAVQAATLRSRELGQAST
jgi:pyrroline-5-carboxylate reductase